MDFSQCNPISTEYDLNGPLLHILRRLEVAMAMSFDDFTELKINSAYRSKEYEKRMGRDGSSSHCLGKAVDISCTSNSKRHFIIKFALQNGINRIGVYKTFIHLDTAIYKDGKQPNIIWYG